MNLHWLLRLLSIGFLLLLCLPLSSQSLEDLKIRINYQDRPLDLIFLDLEINHRLDFSYEKEVIANVRITQNYPRKPFPEAMKLLLQGTGLGFSIESGRKISIFPAAEEPEEVIPEYEGEATAFNLTIAGKISSKSTGESLPYANILVKGTQLGTTANVDGWFTLFDVPTDTSVLEIRYLGYQTTYLRLTPQANFDRLEVQMADRSTLLDAVELVADREEQLLQATSGISQIRVSPAQLATLPSFGEKDIFRSLQLLPGISGSNESSSGLYVRGGTPDQNLIQFDGFTVYHVDHLFGFFSAFNANAIKDVQLYKGGFDARFGGRISSVVELTGKEGNAKEFNIGGGLSLLSVNGFVESPFANGKGTFLVAGRRSFQSSFYNNLFESFTQNAPNNNNENLPGGGFGGRFAQQVEPNSYFYDLNAKVTYRPNDKDQFSLSFFNGEDDLDNSRNFDQNAFAGRFGGGDSDVTFERNNTDLTKWGNWGSSLKWSRPWNDRLYTKAHLSYSNYYSERDRRDAVTIDRGDTTISRSSGSYEFNDLKDVSLKFDNEWKLTPNNQLEFGLQSTFFDIQYDYLQNDTINILNRDDTGLATTLYVQDEQLLFDRLRLQAGLRATHYSVTDEIYYEPRASLSFQLLDRLKLKGAWGHYYQFATRIVREDIQQGSRDFWVLANGDNLPISFAEHFIAGFSYETPEYLFDVEGYYKPMTGLSEYTTRFSGSGFGPNQQLNYEEFFFQGTGVARGVEFLAQKKAGALTGWLGYTLQEVLYDFEVFGDDPFPANQDQTHELKLVANYKWKKWDFSATFVYATGRPYTAPTGFYELDLLDGNTTSFFEVSEKNALRLPDYHRADLAATYHFQLGFTPASLGLSIFNVYNRANLWYKEYEVIESQLIETDISLLNFTPSLFFTWSLK
ncbi:MAG: TonB-dependent receptor [Bacteroidota bacterium]